jgi:hypothetical protein
MRRSKASFGLLQILGMAIAGCLSFATFIDEWVLTGAAVLTAGGLSTWAWVIAKRQYGDYEYWRRY